MFLLSYDMGFLGPNRESLSIYHAFWFDTELDAREFKRTSSDWRARKAKVVERELDIEAINSAYAELKEKGLGHIKDFDRQAFDVLLVLDKQDGNNWDLLRPVVAAFLTIQYGSLKHY